MCEIPEPLRNIEIKYTKLFINNEWLPSEDGTTFDVINPYTTKPICKVAKGGKADIDLAVAAAKMAFEPNSPWRKMKPQERASLLLKLADLIERDRVILSTIESIDIGKIYSRIYESDVLRVIETLRYYAGWTDKLHGTTIPIGDDYFAYTKHEPIGVCGAITPWNVPLIMLGWKSGPCLAAGNTLVLKPSELTPLSSLHIASLVKEAGFPPGVFNVVPGFGSTAGSALTNHMDVCKISFTGSNRVGRMIQKAAADSNFKRLTLELGGKNPLIIFPDVNVDEAVNMAHVAIFSQGGQVCCAGSRTFVHKSIYEEFVEKSVEKAKARKLGDPLDFNIAQGPQISEIQQSMILNMIKQGTKQGCTIRCGGDRIKEERGYFVQPTIITNIDDDNILSKEEVFGPVQLIYKFSSKDEVVRRANDSAYGLVAGVMTNDINTALQISNQVHAGTIWVNCFFQLNPAASFGGFKQSGIGRDLGQDALQSYTELKTVYIKTQA